MVIQINIDNALVVCLMIVIGCTPKWKLAALFRNRNQKKI